MAATVIYSDMGDVDCASIPLLWEGIPDIKLYRLAREKSYFKDELKKAIEDEDDTLIICGHGTPHGLLGYLNTKDSGSSRFWLDDDTRDADYERLRKAGGDRAGVLGPSASRRNRSVEQPTVRTVLDTAVDRNMAKLFHANRVICVWCHASDYAEATGLYGFWSSMFISNVGEAHWCNINDVDQDTIVSETYKFWRDANKLLRENVPLDQWIEKLVEVGNMQYATTRFNYGGLRYYAK